MARRRRHRGTEAVVVVAVAAGAMVVARARADVDDHPRLGTRTMPAETDGFKVLEGGEAVKVVTYFVVRHDGVDDMAVDAVAWNLDCDSLDTTGAHLHVFLGVIVAVVGVEVDVDVTPIGVVADVLHVVVDRDRVGVVHHHGL
jgi:hypothetical protein